MLPVPYAALLPDIIDQINANFAALQLTILSTAASEINSGYAAPVLLTMGADDQHWVLPAGLIGRFIVLDHGLILGSDDYSVVGNEVVLDYSPASPYKIAIAVSKVGAGVTKPVTLTVDGINGPQYWNLPDGHGLNVLVFDHGRMLRRSEYRVVGNQVILESVPTSPYEIEASWGHGGPGLFAPTPLARQFPHPSLDTIHWLLPEGHGPALLILDHGLVLDSTMYTVNLASGVVTLNYTPSTPLDISAVWGWPLSGQYVHEFVLTPYPDGTEDTFEVPIEMLGDTVRVVAKQGATQIFYDRGTDFEIEGRKIIFNSGSEPPSGSTLIASFTTPIHFGLETSQPLIGTNGQSVSEVRGVLIEVSNLTTSYTYSGSDLLSTVVVRDTATMNIVMTISYTYNADTSVNTVTTTAAGKTTVLTLGYDGNGRINQTVRVLS